MKDLVAKQLAALNERLASKKIELGLGEELVRVLSDKGYDEKYGARPLANIFNQMIIRPLSRKLLQGELKEGNLKASWKADKGLVTFKS
jgi:ATP-dependent Clp protease ATP-binding subunit ClpA